ncbi:Xaa-Pro peptidase family protein [Thermomicrobiaceae bacterium CFH 74404]|uniref:Xaa-Pro peptidase family protein n=1 Tax=Thermalbibacter longus TaxID=2951981 RepID=A0AA41WAZ8_9BACT|nr:Xaa-Pro peptidase family protein [Thermalbibacter longus]MCM8749172.1 Xaa-Pro peptidase family protein [Thermalbibacter longus]
MSATNLVREKLVQATQVLQELDLDLWLLMARESDVIGDPSLPLVVGTSVTWESAFLVSRTGEHTAIVGTGDVENIRQTGAWDNVVGYVEGVSRPLLEALERYDPRTIALNYSRDDVLADGLTHGLYLLLQDILEPTPYWSRIRSGEDVARRVRSRKSAEEQRRLRQAVATTLEIWDALRAWLRPGLTEREIAAFMHRQVRERGLETAWDPHYCPTVTAGPDSLVGHVGPTDIAIQRGQLLAIDFGVRQEDYCSDMQRTFYFLAEGETAAPEPVLRAFDLVSGAIQAAAEALRPGVMGWEVDQVAREIFARAGAEEWKFGLGHQVGRAVHDGGCLLGPRWERYGRRPYDRVEPDQVYTLELGVSVPGYGRVSLEEEVIVHASGCEFLAPPQREPILIG